MFEGEQWVYLENDSGGGELNRKKRKTEVDIKTVLNQRRFLQIEK